MVERHGVKIVGHRNVPSRLAADASALYARNLYNFLSRLLGRGGEGRPVLPDDDEIVKGVRLTQGGKVVNERLSGMNRLRPRLSRLGGPRRHVLATAALPAPREPRDELRVCGHPDLRALDSGSAREVAKGEPLIARCDVARSDAISLRDEAARRVRCARATALSSGGPERQIESRPSTRQPMIAKR